MLFIKMKNSMLTMSIFVLMLSFSARAVESIGTCYMDSKCRKPLTDQMVTADQCGRIARRAHYKRAFLLADFSDDQGNLIGRCGLIYNTIVGPEPSNVVAPISCSIMLPACR